MEIELLVLSLVCLTIPVAYSCGGSANCKCSNAGSVNNDCDSNGNCNCRPNIVSQKCDECSTDRIWFPSCLKPCNGKCTMIVAGNRDAWDISKKGYILGVASGDENDGKEFDFDVDDEEEDDYRLLGGKVGDDCVIWTIVGGKGYKVDAQGQVTPLEKDDNTLSRMILPVQFSDRSLIGLSDRFSVAKISSLSEGWSYLIKFSPGAEKETEFGHLVCGARFDSKTVIAVTSGRQSKIMFFNIEEKTWKQGPALGIRKKGLGSCVMLDEKNFFIQTSHDGPIVYNTETGNPVEGYLEYTDSFKEVTDGAILSGNFGLVYVGGIQRRDGQKSKEIFYLPKGDKRWVKSNQELGPGLTMPVACLV